MPAVFLIGAKPSPARSFHIINDRAGHVRSGGLLDSLQPRGRIHLQQQGAAIRRQEIDPGHSQAVGLSSQDRQFNRVLIGLESCRCASLVQV